MPDILGEIDASVQSTLDADTDFQSSIASLPEEDKTQKIEERKSELRGAALAEMKEKAENADKFQKDYEMQKGRAEKLEKDAKANQPASGALSQKDVLYLAKSDIHEDDLDTVTEYAALKKISVADAHKFMKPILDTRAEERRTAAATHTSGGARGGSKETGADILRKAETTGEVPDTDEGMNELFKARQARKIRKR